MEFPVTAPWADDSYRQPGGSVSRTRRPAGFLLLGAGWERELVWSYFWIAIGSAIGGVLRFACSGLIAESIGETFPWGTLAVNVSGSLIIGFFVTLSEPGGRLLVGTPARQFVMVGVCGGFTTFSSFSLQTLNLARDGDWPRASANIVGSVVLCLVAVWLGHIAAAALNR
jgi:CrcB protein